jgi:hypothetical protein
MPVALQLLGPGQPANQFFWAVDQHGNMLRANPILPLLVFNRQQGNLLAVLFAYETYVKI